MSQTQFYLLRSRRFAPLFVTQFLGAMNDNLFKQSLVILITFQLAPRLGLDGPILVTVAAGVFIVPFFLFSATAGQLADKFEKARSIRLIKVFEILIMGLAVGAFAVTDSGFCFPPSGERKGMLILTWQLGQRIFFPQAVFGTANFFWHAGQRNFILSGISHPHA